MKKWFLIFILLFNMIPINIHALEFEKDIVNYNIEKYNDYNIINFVLSDNVGYKDEESKYNVIEIKDVNNNIELTELTYQLIPNKEYEFLFKYIKDNKEYTLTKSIEGNTKNQDTRSISNMSLNDFQYVIENDNTIIIKKINEGVINVHIPNKIDKYTNVKIDTSDIAGIDSFIPKSAQSVVIDPGVIAINTLSRFMQYNNNVNEITGLNNLNLENVRSLEKMFYNSKSLVSIDLSNVNCVNVESMKQMFSGCNSLESINLTNFETNNVTDLSSMFFNCYNLINIYGFNLKANNVYAINKMFYNCQKLTNVNISKINTQNVTSFDHLFYNCYQLNQINIDYLNTDNAINLQKMFYGCRNLEQIDLSKINTKKVENISGMFGECESLMDINMIFNTENVTNMTGLFLGCKKLTNINLENFNTQNVYNMSNMFYGCHSLKQIDVSSFDTNRLIDMSNMFNECINLEKIIGFDKFETVRVTSMPCLFANCQKLKEIDLSNFQTNNLKNINKMFFNCYQLNFIDLSTFNALNIEDYSNVFYCDIKTNKMIILSDSLSLKMNNYSFLSDNVSAAKITFNKVYDYLKNKIVYTNSEWEELKNLDNFKKYVKEITYQGSYLKWINEETKENVEEIKNIESIINTNFVENTTIKYQVIFNSNNLNEQIIRQEFHFNEEKNLMLNIFSYNGYVFDSWNTKPDGSGEKYQDGEMVVNLTKESEINLYAQWKLPSDIDFTFNVSDDGYWNSNANNDQIIEINNPIDGFIINSESNAFIYSGSFSSVWSNEVNTNEVLNNSGINLEALKINLKEEYLNQYNVYYRVKTKGFGWLGWAKNGEVVGSQGYNDYLVGIQIKVINKEQPEIQETIPAFINTQITYQGKVEGKEWQDWLVGGDSLGTEGLGLRLEAMRIKLLNTEMFGENQANVLYQSHVQNVGWEGKDQQGNDDLNKYLKNGAISGTENRGLRIEATQILLQGDIANYFNVYYRTQVENTGWLDWGVNNEQSGSSRYARRIETIQIQLVPKGLSEEFLAQNPNPSTNKPIGVWQSFIEQQSVWYDTHNAYEDWKGENKDGNTVGSAINSIESLRIFMDPANTYQGDIFYRVKATNGSWSSVKTNNAFAGEVGISNRIEAFNVYVEPGSKLEQNFDVYYRALVDGEWLGYAKNGQVAGYEGKNITAISIMFVPKIIQYDHDKAYKNRNNQYVIINKEDI